MTHDKTMLEPNEVTGHVASADGTVIGYRQLGAGPAVILLHGGLMASDDYVALGRQLADRYTVYIPDRRGRGLSGPYTDDHGIVKEVEDLNALIRHSGAERVFGHSAGGCIALEAALTLPIRKLAVYEPPIVVNGRITLPLDWLPAYEKALARGRHADAAAIFLKGMRMNWMSNMPQFLLASFARLLFRGPEGEERIRRLPTVTYDMITARQLGSSERFRSVAADTLLLGGTKSPEYLRAALVSLRDVIPRCQRVEFPKLDHSAPVQGAREEVGDELLRFF